MRTFVITTASGEEVTVEADDVDVENGHAKFLVDGSVVADFTGYQGFYPKS